MENNQPIIIKRVKRIAGGHHGGAWKIAFADFATAMMAFFLVLWLLSTATPEQKIAIAGYFKDPVGFSESGTPYIIDLGGTPTLAPENTLNPEVKSQPQPDKVTIDAEQVEGMAEQVEKERLELLLQELQTKVEENPQLKKFKDQISFEITPDGLRIQIVDAENRPMFDSGSARLKPYFEDILLAMADTIKAVPNKISISGHTTSCSIGLQYGPVWAGTIGISRRFGPTLIGDAVNVAARLEQQARRLDAQIVIGNEVMQRARQECGSHASELEPFVNVGPLCIRGRPSPVHVWKLQKQAEILLRDS